MPSARKAHPKALQASEDGRTPAALLETAALQRAMSNRANVSRIGTDPQGIIRIFNAGAEEMLGYSAAEVVDTLTPGRRFATLRTCSRVPAR